MISQTNQPDNIQARTDNPSTTTNKEKSFNQSESIQLDSDNKKSINEIRNKYNQRHSSIVINQSQENPINQSEDQHTNDIDESKQIKKINNIYKKTHTGDEYETSSNNGKSPTPRKKKVPLTRNKSALQLAKSTTLMNLNNYEKNIRTHRDFNPNKNYRTRFDDQETNLNY